MAAPEQLDLLDRLAAQAAEPTPACSAPAEAGPPPDDAPTPSIAATAPEGPPLLLTRLDAARNMRRPYGLALVRSLWGEVGVTRRWGRIGSRGERRTDRHESARAAAAAFERLARTKRRKGYRRARPPPRFRV